MRVGNYRGSMLLGRPVTLFGGINKMNESGSLYTLLQKIIQQLDAFR